MDPNETEISVNEIAPGLWLGNQAASQSDKFINSKNIDAIVNCTKHIPNKFKGLAYLRIPVNDPGPASGVMNEDHKKMLENLITALEFIDSHIKAGKNVLVHCHAGMQRSATVVIYYLMCVSKIENIPAGRVSRKKLAQIKYRSTLSHVLAKRPIVYVYGISNNFKPVFDYLIDSL